jgi:hypothetical protein
MHELIPFELLNFKRGLQLCQSFELGDIAAVRRRFSPGLFELGDECVTDLSLKTCAVRIDDTKRLGLHDRQPVRFGETAELCTMRV